MQQHYQLGKLLRNRYIDERPGFLEPRYKSKQVYIQSTDYNRTLISAMSNLAGMFPTGVPGTEYPDSSEWPSNWTPIPVHTVKFDTDFVGNMWAVCPRKTELDKFIQSSAEYQRVVNENKEFFKFLSNKTGMPVTMYDMYTLYDVHFIETKYNLSQPEWFTEKVAKKIWNLTHIKNEFNYGISKPYVPELIKLRGGPLLKEMVERMLEKVECLEHPSARCKWIQNLKYHAYSAHDTTIAGFLSTLGDEEKVIGGISLPQYTAAIAVELWNVTSVGPSVKILYHPGYNHHFHTITGLTKGCPQRQEFCKLDTFHRRSKIFMPGNMEEDCKPKAGQYHSDEGMNSTKRKLRMRHT
ncbi:hypothetical protein L596_003216 [Steinernema carpocapsae]|uniref:Histidine acid phosphatase n=1 Tax=Steinernema carpocapsae TaxID=34508 RepID=A0A4U8UVU6_STECR|nr:hypothetical protein L596_003216 [Steinernema carpocapsae]